MTKDRTVQHVGSTLSFPGKHVVGVFGSFQEAEQAVQALVKPRALSRSLAFLT